MNIILSILLCCIHFCYATNCYELQQAQISSLNDRMFQMLNSFYTPLPQNSVPAVAAASSPDYSNPYSVYPYPYPLPPSGMYGPTPAFYTPAPVPPPVPSVPGTPRTTPPTYYNLNPKEYNAVSNWGSYYDSYPQYYDHTRPSLYDPLVPSYQIPPSTYPAPLTPSLPHPSPCVTPYASSPSPPPPYFPSWEYAPYTSEYATRNYAPPPPIPSYAVPPPPSPLPAPYPYFY